MSDGRGGGMQSVDCGCLWRQGRSLKGLLLIARVHRSNDLSRNKGTIKLICIKKVYSKEKVKKVYSKEKVKKCTAKRK